MQIRFMQMSLNWTNMYIIIQAMSWLSNDTLFAFLSYNVMKLLPKMLIFIDKQKYHGYDGNRQVSSKCTDFSALKIYVWIHLVF